MYKPNSLTNSAAKITFASITMLLLAGCPFDDDDDNDTDVIEMPMPEPPAEYSYQIEVTNLTNGQPMSPVAVVLHGDEQLWQVGMSSTNALEILAEGGDNSSFTSQEQVLAAASGDDILMPGNSTTISITTTDEMANHISIATMLVNTNDAFSGLTGLDLSSMAVDSSFSRNIGTYDAGTEANTEASGTIPGPADGGTGYSDVRDDIDVVAMHAGVVTADDGLSSSVLNQAHRFDNPTIRLTITRTK
ncbi:hypothetical protein HII17_01370 [Thalassotalea sp. M1531]|uniref:Spondin domain-containing protein n=1 Tax=Thalassotalea algicola TaxID=2716224 RepID=A0A7Y0Q5X3_9GAMM|nr:spondin domain-containing protein [Thalassotalea algicola]NMP30197.1 hypothetical protein [Thalassotalea algicola]